VVELLDLTVRAGIDRNRCDTKKKRTRRHWGEKFLNLSSWRGLAPVVAGGLDDVHGITLKAWLIRLKHPRNLFVLS
jgi:hypothetical protein